MLSSISEGSFDLDDPMCLMWLAATRTLNALNETRERARSTQARLETLWREGLTSSHSLEADWASLKARGIRSSRRKIERNFLTLLKNFALGISSPNSDLCTPSPDGSGPTTTFGTSSQPISNVQMELFLTWLASELEFWTQEVSHAASLAYCRASRGADRSGLKPLPPPVGLPEHILKF